MSTEKEAVGGNATQFVLANSNLVCTVDPSAASGGNTGTISIEVWVGASQTFEPHIDESGNPKTIPANKYQSFRIRNWNVSAVRAVSAQAGDVFTLSTDGVAHPAQ